MDFFLAAVFLLGVDISPPLELLLNPGDSKSKLFAPPEGVLDPVRAGDAIGDSLIGSAGETTRDFSLPVIASEIARKPRPRFLPDDECEGNSQSDALPDRLRGEVLVSSSSLVTVGDVSLDVDIGFNSAEVAEGALFRPGNIIP